MKDQIQAYWDRQPCNINHSKQLVGSPEYWAEVTAKKYRAEPHILKFANHAAWAGKRVLEVGCGLGTDAEQFARAGADYTGVDFSQKSLDLARGRFDTLGLEGRFFVADAENLDPGQLGQAYDLVYSFGVLHHTPSPSQAVAGIRRILRPGGEFRLMLYASNSWKNIMIENGLAQPEAQGGCPLARTYTKGQVYDLLKEFVDIRIEQTHIWPWQVDKYKQNQWEKEPWFAAMPDEMFSALEKSLGWHLLISARK